MTERVGDGQIYKLIQQAMLAEPMSDAQASSLAQAHGDSVEPSHMQNVYDALVRAYGEVGSAALVSAGVPEEKISDAMQWLKDNRKGQLIEAGYDLVAQSKRSTSALKALGKGYMRVTGATSPTTS